MRAGRLLFELAARFGIMPSYVDQGGTRRLTSDATRVALLAAMGVDASTEVAIRRALEAEKGEVGRRVLPAVQVVPANGAHMVKAVLPRRVRAAATGWGLEVREEGGEIHRLAGRLQSRPVSGVLRIRLPTTLPLGYHNVRLSLETSGSGHHEAEQLLVVTPPRCPTPKDQLGGRRVYGLLANLYTLRSRRNWGAGDLTDLRYLVAFAADVGAAFVGINPLHALTNEGDDISPYSPVSRLYRNVLYLDVGAMPELADLPAQRAYLARPEMRGELCRLRAGTHVDYERVMALKRPVFEALHRCFATRHRDRDTARGRAYRRYLAEQGEPLVYFATFAALREHFLRCGRAARSWRDWPSTYRHPRSSAVRSFRAAHREEVDLHCYLQFELDRQLAGVAGQARRRGLSIGVYEDLAIGSAAGGSDTWAFPGLFLEGANVGAPPDDYSAEGQNWGLPPVDPRRLAADGYRYWICLVRSALRHAGALRLDHVMGLFRQFWIPAGHEVRGGAYVHFPAADLLGILALESQRAGTLVIGEDLGVVPRGLSRSLARWGILSTRVLYFARTARGTFWPVRAYPERALVAANTHDMVPLAGFWKEHDLAIKRQLGQLQSCAAVAAARAERVRVRRALVRRLRSEGVLPRASRPMADCEVRAAVHAFLCRTPAVLVGIALDDLTGEMTPVNLPGVGLDRYPSWSRRQRLPLEALRSDRDVSAALAGVRGSGRSELRRPLVNRDAAQGGTAPMPG